MTEYQFCIFESWLIAVIDEKLISFSGRDSGQEHLRAERLKDELTIVFGWKKEP